MGVWMVVARCTILFHVTLLLGLVYLRTQLLVSLKMAVFKRWSFSYTKVLFSYITIFLVGSAHTVLASYWSQRLKKDDFYGEFHSSK